MKKVIALSILAATVLSGCAVYPTGYSEYSSYNYDYVPASSGVIYIDQTYVTPTPYPYWRNNYPNHRWDNRPPVRPPHMGPPGSRPNIDRPPQGRPNVGNVGIGTGNIGNPPNQRPPQNNVGNANRPPPSQGKPNPNNNNENNGNRPNR